MNLCEAWREYRKDSKAKGVRRPFWARGCYAEMRGDGFVCWNRLVRDGEALAIEFEGNDLTSDDWEVVR